jgi:hypothetical protein
MKNKFLFRFAVLIILVVIFLIYVSYPCLVIKLSSYPEIIKSNATGDIDGLLFIYGDSICGVCPQGRFINERINKPTTMIIYPPKLRLFEVNNFKESYDFNNAKTIKGNTEVLNFLKHIHSCSGNKREFSNNSFYIKLDEKKEIKAYYLF